MVKATLFWMDAIRARWKTYLFKNRKEKLVVKDFLGPLLLMGKQAEIDARIGLRKSHKEAVVEAKRFEGEMKVLEESLVKVSKELKR